MSIFPHSHISHTLINDCLTNILLLLYSYRLNTRSPNSQAPSASSMARSKSLKAPTSQVRKSTILFIFSITNTNLIIFIFPEHVEQVKNPTEAQSSALRRHLQVRPIIESVDQKGGKCCQIFPDSIPSQQFSNKIPFLHSYTGKINNNNLN